MSSLDRAISAAREINSDMSNSVSNFNVFEKRGSYGSPFKMMRPKGQQPRTTSNLGSKSIRFSRPNSNIFNPYSESEDDNRETKQI